MSSITRLSTLLMQGSRFSIIRSTQLIGFLIATAVLLLHCGGCSEVQKKHYDNLDFVRREHTIEKGWIPAFISPDAKDINFEGDLDLASVYGSYISSNTDLLRKHCSGTGDSFPVPGYGPKWFRDDLKEGDTAGKLRRKGYKVFRCDDGFNVVVVSSRNYVYYWSVRQ